MLYVIDANAKKETLKKFANEGAHFLLLEEVKEEIFRFQEDLKEAVIAWEEQGILQVRNKHVENSSSTEDRLIEFCQELQAEGKEIELLSNDIVVHLKANQKGIHVSVT